MKPNTLYVWLAVVGTVLPLAFFVPFLLAHGLDIPVFVAQLFANPVSGFFAMDVLVSGLATVVFTLAESWRLRLKSGPLCLLGLLVGVSVALPLFLYVRQRHLNALASHQKDLI